MCKDGTQMVIKNLKTHSPKLPTFKSLKPGDVFVVADDTASYFLKIQESVTTEVWAFRWPAIEA